MINKNSIIRFVIYSISTHTILKANIRGLEIQLWQDSITSENFLKKKIYKNDNWLISRRLFFFVLIFWMLMTKMIKFLINKRTIKLINNDNIVYLRKSVNCSICFRTTISKRFFLISCENIFSSNPCNTGLYAAAAAASASNNPNKNLKQSSWKAS